ncbi:MAG: hypothetical protein IKE05_05335 [Clostridia bacterium]|nr:hypothetical protein [Clostridia bacterium]
MAGRFSGLHMAVVTKVGGDKDGLNRVETKMVNEGVNGIKLNPAPVLTDSAGSDYGIVSHPKKGDCVIVAFLDGDMQKPIILGSIPTPTRKPPFKVTNKNNTRVHKTADGAEIRIEEDKEDTKFIIKTKGGHTVILEDSSSNNLVKVKSKDSKTSFTMDLKKSTVEIKARAIHFKGENEVSIKAGDSSVTVSNSSGVNIKSSKGNLSAKVNKIDLKANANATLAANAQVKLQGTGGANLKSSGITQVGGSLVKIG